MALKVPGLRSPCGMQEEVQGVVVSLQRHPAPMFMTESPWEHNARKATHSPEGQTASLQLPLTAPPTGLVTLCRSNPTSTRNTGYTTTPLEKVLGTLGLQRPQQLGCGKAITGWTGQPGLGTAGPVPQHFIGEPVPGWCWLLDRAAEALPLT